MSNDYVPPKYYEDAFNCPFCNAYAQQEWISGAHGTYKGQYRKELDEFNFSECQKCHEKSIWLNDKMIYPNKHIAPLASEDIPENILQVYNEAREIFEKSPRASAALLRLCIQLLCKDLGEKGKNINEDIASLVSKGLPVRIQKALDTVRVIGNNAVHPGEINLNDNPSISLALFKLINLIIDKMITQPKEIDELFDNLPGGAIKAIEKRDKK